MKKSPVPQEPPRDRDQSPIPNQSPIPEEPPRVQMRSRFWCSRSVTEGEVTKLGASEAAAERPKVIMKFEELNRTCGVGDFFALGFSWRSNEPDDGFHWSVHLHAGRGEKH